MARKRPSRKARPSARQLPRDLWHEVMTVRTIDTTLRIDAAPLIERMRETADKVQWYYGEHDRSATIAAIRDFHRQLTDLTHYVAKLAEGTPASQAMNIAA